MTERPTEQTHPRLTGLDSPTSTSSQAPILPPMPSASADRTDYRPQTAPEAERPSLADRLQEKLSSVRQAERPAERLNGAPDQTAVRPAVQASTAAPEAPTAPSQAQPVLPPPAADQPAPQPAQRPAKKRPGRAQRPKRPPRRARLRLTRIDPWSVMKTAFLLSIALGVVTIVSVLMVWSVLGAAGVWDSINTTVRDIVGDQSTTPFTIQDYLGTDRVIGFTMLVAVIDVVLLTAIATLAAFLYNMAAALLGGIDITLVEDER
jgi:Transmembrane domain of unknown function (DUF3566)